MIAQVNTKLFEDIGLFEVGNIQRYKAKPFTFASGSMARLRMCDRHLKMGVQLDISLCPKCDTSLLCPCSLDVLRL